MKLALALAATAVLVAAVDQQENSPGRGTLFRPATRNISIIGEDNVIGEIVSDGVVYDKNGQLADLKKLIFGSLTPQEEAIVNFTPEQKAWYMGVLEKLAAREKDILTVDNDSLLFEGMSEEEQNKLNLTMPQRLWAAGVLHSLADEMKHSQAEKVKLQPVANSINSKTSTVFLTTSLLAASTTRTTTSTTEAVREVKKEAPKEKDEKKDAKKTEPKTKSTSSASAAKGNKTNGLRSAGSGARATKDAWAIFAGAIAAVLLVSL